MKSIKIKLALLLGIIMLVVCSGLGLLANNASTNAIQTVAEEMMTNLISESAKVVKERINSQFGILEALVNVEKMRDTKVPLQDKLDYLKLEAQRTGFASFGMVDTSGNMLTTIGAKANLSERAYIKKALNGEASITDPMISKVDGKLIVIYAVPIKGFDGNVIGVLLGQRDGNEISAITNDIVLGKSGRAYMLNSAATVIAHYDPKLVVDGYNGIEQAKKDPKLEALAKIQNRMILGEKGFGDYSYEGIIKFVAFAPVNINGWSIAVTVPKTEVLSTLNTLRASLLIASILFLLAGCIVVYFVARYFTKQLNMIVEHLNILSSGDFSVKKMLSNKAKKDEIDTAFESMQQMQSSVSGMIKAIKDTSLGLDDQSQNLSAVSEEMSATTETISTSIHESAKGVNTQAIGLSNIADAMNNFSEKMENILNNIQDVVTNSTEINNMATNGNKNMELMIESVNKVSDSFKDFIGKIDGLSQNINKITEITNLINNIAEQTNLLALNAAIEAARAGESGKGFAVVADEIRKLAEQAKNSSQVINTMVTNISSDAGTIMNTTDGLNHELEIQVNSINTALDAYKNIVIAIGDIGAKIQSVSISAKEINNEKTNILDNVESASAVAEEVSATSEEVAASASELSNSSREIASSAELLNGMTSDMLKQINKFKI